MDELQVNDPAILEIEEELDNTLADICETQNKDIQNDKWWETNQAHDQPGKEDWRLLQHKSLQTPTMWVQSKVE